ncbi:hypothetical protein [Chromobacterium haemolyticum]|uniref:hypothetical protein n=1 Tax=Chromobacterium haemolyticum TaxID=394935 RepID=UPI0013198ACF|nr:hypothetical protein [Chromobacterium haemolyticum]BBH11720.1 hypothetical protein CH06BL_09680 [Chromobacterium haemolyticum]
MSEAITIRAGNIVGLKACVQFCPDEMARQIENILNDYGSQVSDTRAEVVKRRIAAAIADLADVRLYSLAIS